MPYQNAGALIHTQPAYVRLSFNRPGIGRAGYRGGGRVVWRWNWRRADWACWDLKARGGGWFYRAGINGLVPGSRLIQARIQRQLRP